MISDEQLQEWESEAKQRSFLFYADAMKLIEEVRKLNQLIHDYQHLLSPPEGKVLA